MNESTASAADLDNELSHEASLVAPVKPERIIFKGDEKSFADVKVGEVVQVIDRGAGGNRKPGIGIINGTQPGIYSDEMYVSFLNPRNSFQATYNYPVKRAAKVVALTGRMGEKIRAEYAAWQNKNKGRCVPFIYLTNGADPEMFVVDKNNDVIPAWKFLGSKSAPSVGPTPSPRYSRLYWDGFQAEFTVPGTSTCLEAFTTYIGSGLQDLHNLAKEVGGKLSMASVLPVQQDILMEGREEHVQFGCKPSFNAYGLSGLVRSGRDVPFRFAGGHMHFGLGRLNNTRPNEPAINFHKNPKQIKDVVWAMDAIIGIASVSLFESMDIPVRREFYGLPGEYRLPSHGIEYRTLSNAWLCHPVIMNLVYELGRAAFHVGYQGYCNQIDAGESEVLDCILRSDAEVARAILKRNRDLVTGLLARRLTDPELAYEVFAKDVSETIKDPSDVVSNWALDARYYSTFNWGSRRAEIKGGIKL